MIMRRSFFLGLPGLSLLAAPNAQVSKLVVEKEVAENESTLGAVDGTNKVFILSYVPSSNASVHVYLSGLHQREGRDYTLSGKTLTFAVAPDARASIDVNYRGEFNA